jgi:signal transduction histidine kinase/DNA-binding response OmpR family regulator
MLIDPTPRPIENFFARRLLLLTAAISLGQLLAATEFRSMEAYRIDPLTESWRWQRVEGLEGRTLEIVELGNDGRLGVVQSPNRLFFYDGLTVQESDLPEDLSGQSINAFHISSRGHYCVVTDESIVLFDGSAWQSVASTGLSRRVWDGIVEGPDGILWIGIDAGVARLDPATGECRITPSPGAVMSLCMGPDQQSIWISTAPRGEILEGQLLDGLLVPGAQWMSRKPPMRYEILAMSLMRASDGRIWQINNHHNLPAAVFDPQVGSWQEINLSGLGGDNFDFSILETPDGAIWISSRGSLHILNEDKWTVYHSPEFPLPGARSTMYQDGKGTVSIVEAGGINVQIDYGQKQGLSFQGLHFQDNAADGSLLFISIDNEVIQWQEDAAGAMVYSPEKTGIANPGTLIVHSNGDWILAGSTDREAAVSIYNGETWHPYRFPEVGLSFGHLAVLEQPNGEIWLGCAQLEEEFPEFLGGIVVLSPGPDDNYSEKYLHPPEYAFRNWSLLKGPAGTVLSSGNGIFENTSTSARLVNLPEAIGYKWIDQAAVDDAGDLWCAVWSLGVFRRHKGEWTQFTSADGLESPLTSFIFCLDGKDPVATTPEGHFRFDGQRWAPFMGNIEGLHRGSGRVVQDRVGSIWINHTHVDWYYRGQRTEAYSEDKKKSFRTIQYIPDPQAPDTQWVKAPPDLVRQASLEFEWQGVDAWSKTDPDELQYSYRVDARDWSAFTPRKEVVLPELKGGMHALEVRARDTDFNIDPTPLSGTFTIVLPVWQQGWFIIGVTSVIVLVIAFIVLFVRQRVKHLLEIEQVKMRFFTHLSHEIKTPLSLILGPVERLQNEVSDSRHQHYLSLIKSNSQRLLFLINQLLDFRKFQLNKLEYQPEEGDLIPFTRSCLSVFDGWVSEKGHILELQTELPDFVFAFDHEMFHKIIDNLVNNAVKYTQPGGHITVRVSKSWSHGGETSGVIEVEDDGPGVPESEQEAIFEPFYRSPSSGQFEEGSGIGLAFVKDLVTAIQGTITIHSPASTADPARPGTLFRVTFPVKPGSTATRQSPASEPAAPARVAVKEAEETAGKSIILLIEDNHDLREFISSELSGAFHIETAENAGEGIAKAREFIPDIIVSDVVMPGKSGFEVCQILKKDAHTSHIPVILLTALRSEEHKLQAYQCGADDFITKPVSPEILRLKIRNQLATQQQARERVREKFVEDHRLTGLAGEDQAFLDKATELVDEHLSSEQFDVNALAEKMGFSRSAFYRKFNSLTELSPAAFIKTKRLRQAAVWLAEGRKSVSEIAYDVGFSDAGYFSRVFKDEYKCSPSEFARRKSDG